MKKFLLITFMSVSYFAYPQAHSIKEYFTLKTDKVFEKILKIRRSLHANPELAGKERNTQNIIKKYLIDLGLEVKTNIYGYGVIGILKGEQRGKSIAWRADMDALPNDFPDNVEFKSTLKNVQHGCGHDVHMAIALGIAEVLSKNKKGLKGTVYFIFQPEEESFKGAKGMIENKLFSRIKPNEIYGLHITPFPVGQIMVKTKEMYAYQKGVRITFNNNISADDVASLKAELQKVLTRTKNDSKPWEIQQALDPSIGLANPNTIFSNYFLIDPNGGSYVKSDTLFVDIDVYETEAAKLQDILPAVKRAVLDHKVATSLLSVSFFKENATVYNNTKLTNQSVEILDKVFGKGTVTIDYGQVPFSNDDFSYFQQKIPGVYFFLGGSNFEKGMIAMIHAPNFMVDEECIKVGIKNFSALIFQRLQI